MASRVARDDVNRSERVQKKENNIQMDKDDFLLTQIDEFREKAKRLQEMLNTKESKAEELSVIVEERSCSRYLTRDRKKPMESLHRLLSR